MKDGIFLVKISNIIELPVEGSTLDGQTNKNHLMYLAQAALEQKGFSATQAIYEFTLRERIDGKLVDTKL